jgi:hypothetical protein
LSLPLSSTLQGCWVSCREWPAFLFLSSLAVIGDSNLDFLPGALAPPF